MITATLFTFLFLQTIAQEQAVPQLLIATPPAAQAQAAGTGIVILDAVITREGRLMDVRVLQGTSAFIEPSLRVVRQWEFGPPETVGTLSRQVRISITFLYRERPILPQPTYEFSIGTAPAQGDHPPLPITIVDPGYPASSIGRGAVIVQGRISAAGSVEGVTVVRPEPSLTDATVSAVQRWKFSPAMRDGMSASGSAIAVVIFQPPAFSNAR